MPEKRLHSLKKGQERHSTIAIPSWLVIACILSGLFTSCENKQKDIDTWTKKVALTEEAINIESMLSQDGKLRATLKAPFMRRVFEDTVYTEFPKSLHCIFYNSNNQVESWLDCKYGKYYESLGKVYLRDSVVVITIKGDTLKSPDLWWDQNQKKFYTDKYAVYHAPGKQLYGTVGLEASQDLSSIIFKNPVGTIRVNETGMPQ
jgi:LPS export ABC transporter protein LptC